jgi:DNA-binding beta-propeller fold protein YncE
MLALIYLGLAICVGERLCGRFYRFVSTSHRWATGALVGLLLSACFTYLAALQFARANNPLLWGDLLFFAAASIFLLNCRPKRDPLPGQLRVSGSETWDWVTLAIFFALACWMMFATLNYKEGRIEIGVTQWSDYGPNTAIVQNFAFGHNFPAEYPHFSGEPIRYHFLFYFLAGNLEFLGLNLAWSVNTLSVLTLVCMLALVMALGELLFKSRAVGVVASALFFFHGTLNLVPFFRAQTSFKGALLAIYHLAGYLSSGYPYRGEDWGIWTQVVFINQRHLASSIGIFLIVLFFLFDRYLESAKQRKLGRALRAVRGPIRPQATDEPPVAAGIPARREEGEWAADVGSENNAQTSDIAALEQSSLTPEIILTSEVHSSGTVESLEESSQAAHYAPPVETQTSDIPAYNEPSRPEPETISTSELQPSGTVESLESSQAANYASAGEAPTFHTLAYNEYMRQDTTAASEAEEAEALEFIRQSSREPDTIPVAEAQPSDTPFAEQSPPERETAAVIETQSPRAPVSEAVNKASRGLIAALVHDNLVYGKGFIFSGLLLGALPYWNSPVFTAAAAVLAFLFVLFPCRRYMVGLAVTAAVVAIPQVLALRSGNVRAGPALLHWGYTLGNVPVLQVLKYLGFTFGVKWFLILIALIFFSWRHLRLFIAIFSLFLLTFCFQFSDEILANHKFLNIWLVLANLFVAYGLYRLWRLRIKGWALPFRVIAVLLASPIVIGGVIDFFPIHNANFIETNYTKDRLIDWIRAETKPDAIFLSDKFVNHPILLAGRRIFYGYTYFTWSSGYDLPKREVAYKLMFESKNAHQVFTLLKANGIDYVAFDSGIRGAFKNSNEQQVYAPNFKKVFEGPEYWQLIIYKVPENADFVPTSAAPVKGSPPAPGISLFEAGPGKENGQFDFPRGLAVDNSGNILVADTNNGRLQKFSPTGVFLNVFGKAGRGPGEFQQPCGIAADSSGNIYVADVLNNRIQKLKPDGTFVAEWKGPETGFYGPRDVVVGPDNSVYVLDQGNSRVVKFDPEGKVLAFWGTLGNEDGQFGDATSVAVDGKNDRVYVADLRNKRIVVFDTNGKFVTTWPVEEWRAPTGWYFQDLVIDSQKGRLYASSVATDEVLVFDLTGKKIASLRPAPPDKLAGASSMALVRDKLYVLNTYASRLSQIDVGK